MLKRAVLGWLVVGLVILAAACSARLLDFTVVSSKNVDMRVPESSRGSRVVGVDKVTNVLGIPLGTPNLKEAVDRAIEKAGPGYDALIDGVIYSFSKSYILFGSSGFRIEGTPVKTKDLLTSAAAEGSVIYHSSLGKDNSKALEAVPVVPVKEHR